MKTKGQQGTGFSTGPWSWTKQKTGHAAGEEPEIQTPEGGGSRQCGPRMGHPLSDPGDAGPVCSSYSRAEASARSGGASHAAHGLSRAARARGMTRMAPTCGAGMV